MPKKKLLLAALLFLAVFKIFAQNVEIVLQTGHSAPVIALTLSQDGKFLAAADQNNILKIRDLTTGKEIKNLTFNPALPENKDRTVANFTDLLFSQDDKTLFSANKNGEISEWEVASGKEIRHFSETVSDNKIILLPNKILFYRQNEEKDSVLLKDGATHKIQVFTTEKKRKITAFSLSPDGKMLILADSEKQITLFNTVNLQKISTFSGFQTEITDVFLTLDGNFLLAATNSELIWQNLKSKLIKKSKKGEGNLQLSADHKTLLVPSEKGGLEVWDILSQKKTTEIPNDTELTQTLHLNHDGRFLAKGLKNGRTEFWNLQNGTLATTFRQWIRQNACSFLSSDGKTLLVGSEGGFGSLWNPVSGQKTDFLQTENTEFTCATMNNNRVAFGTKNNNLLVFNRQTQEIRKLTGHVEQISAVKLLPDGKNLVSSSYDQTIKIWDLNSNQATKTLTGHTAAVNTLALDSTGKTLFSAGDDKNLIINTLPDGKQKEKLSLFVINHLVLSKDQNLLALGGENLMLLNLKTRQQTYLNDMNGSKQTSLHFVALSPDNQWLAAAQNNAKTGIWDLKTGKKITEIEGETVSLHFSSDSKFLYLVLPECFVKVCKSGTWQEVVKMISVGESDFVTISPEGFYMASENGLQGIGFHTNTQVLPVEPFALAFDRPEKIAEKLELSDKNRVLALQKAFQNRLKNLNFPIEKLGTQLKLPEIKVITPKLPVAVNLKTWAVAVEASDAEFLLDRIFITLNGVPLFGSKGLDILPKKTKTFLQTFNIPLGNGKNRISVWCMNEKGVQSIPQSFDINYAGTPEKPDLYVLAFGVSNYKNEKLNLQFPAKDGSDLTKFLVQYGKEKNKFGKIVVDTFFNENLTPEIVKNLKTKLLKTKPDDMVLFFSGGNSVVNKELNTYFALSGTDFGQPENSSLLFEKIENLLDSIPARNKTWFADFCLAAELEKDEEGKLFFKSTDDGEVKFRNVGDKSTRFKHLGFANSTEMLKIRLADFAKNSGTNVITSVSSAEFGFDNDDTVNGIFAYLLLTGLSNKKADLNQDGIVSFAELQNYLQNQLKYLTNDRQKSIIQSANGFLP